MKKTDQAMCIKEMHGFRVGIIYPITQEIKYDGHVSLEFIYVVNENTEEVPIQYEEFKEFFVYNEEFKEFFVYNEEKSKPTINENRRIALELAIKNKGEKQSLTMEILFKEADEILYYLTK